ncbi:hypothetical protein DYBT9623_02592 [Dyadobacter sp. CECT 9623]|uniref:Thioredoxin-like fold domain-containing protein n=1 Tax=Dyadobacter linearis TaxID=2823330 RepID=A0ABN7R723_9BACT|nr:hypothetical protein DYBT9623_02592 [Dyadobacter sp. CECT 9623]
MIAECAAQHGRFWEAHDLLYESVPVDPIDFSQIYDKLGLRNVACKDSLKLVSRISLSMNNLRSLGITSTPTMLINDRVYYGPLTFDAIERFMNDLFIKP